MQQTTPTNKNSNTAGAQRQKCEVYSRVSGYLRPVHLWHQGKQAEFYDRKTYKVKGE